MDHLKREFLNRLQPELQFLVKSKQPPDYTAAYNEAELHELLLSAKRTQELGQPLAHRPVEVAALQEQLHHLSVNNPPARQLDRRDQRSGGEARRCYHCRRTGHVIRDCRQRMADESRQQGHGESSRNHYQARTPERGSGGSNHYGYRARSPEQYHHRQHTPDRSYQRQEPPSPGRYQPRSPARQYEPHRRSQSPHQPGGSQRHQSPHPRSVHFDSSNNPAPIRTLDAGPPVPNRSTKPTLWKSSFNSVPSLLVLMTVLGCLAPVLAGATEQAASVNLLATTPMLCLADSSKSLWKLPGGDQCPDEDWFTAKAPTPWPIRFYRPNTIRYESRASVCKCWTTTVCRKIGLFGGSEEENSTTIQIPTISQCWDMLSMGTTPVGPLIHYTNFSTTGNQHSSEWPTWPNLFRSCEEIHNCHLINTTVFTRFGANAISTPAGPASHCQYHEGSCSLDNSALVWNPEPQHRCSMISVAEYNGAYSSGVWVADNVNFALSFQNQSKVTSCNDSLIMTDQGYGVRDEDYRKLLAAHTIQAPDPKLRHKRSYTAAETTPSAVPNPVPTRAKRSTPPGHHPFLSYLENEQPAHTGVVYTNQLAASLTHVAHQLETNTRKLFTTAVRQICGLIENLTEAVLSLASANPTMLARKLLNQTYVSARLASPEVLEIQPCVPMSMQSIHFHHRVQSSCYDKLPIRFFYDNLLRDGYLDPITHIIATDALEYPCATHRYVYLGMNNGQLQRYDQLSGEVKYLGPGEVQEIRKFGKLDLPQSMFTETIIRNHIIADLSEITDLASQLSSTFKYSDIRRQLAALNMDPKRMPERSFNDEVGALAEAITARGTFAFLHGGLVSLYQLWTFACCLYTTLHLIITWVLPAIVSKVLEPLTMADGALGLFRTTRRRYRELQLRRQQQAVDPNEQGLELHEPRPALGLCERQLALPPPSTEGQPIYPPIHSNPSSAPTSSSTTTSETRIMTMQASQEIDDARVWGLINGLPARLLVDTGASITVCEIDVAVRYQLVARSQLYLLQPPSVPSVLGVDDQPIYPLGWLSCTLKLGDACCQMKVHIMADPIGHRHSPYSFIIGYDTLRLLPPITLDAANCLFWFLPRNSLALPPTVASTGLYAIGTAENDLIPPSLTAEQKGRLQQCLDRHTRAFSQHDYDIGDCQITVSPVVTTTEIPVASRPTRLPEKLRLRQDEDIARMIQAGIAKESNTPWLANLVVVKKANGEDRLCANLQRLNHITVPDHYPLPHIATLLDRIAGHNFYSTLDLASGFWQFKLDPESSRKCGIVTENGTFQMLRLPFGLRNAPAVFQREMNRVLKGIPNVLCYLDDIVIYTHCYETHLETLEAVLERMEAYGLKLKPRKCKLIRTSLDFLGHRVGADGYRPSSAHTDSISHFEPPRDKRELKRFLGLSSFFRKFVNNYAQIAHPLQKLLKEEAEYCWSAPQQEAFDELKRLLTTAPCLRSPDYSKEFLLFTDASSVAVAGALMQHDEKGNPYAVAYASKALNDTQQRWPATHTELYAIVFALQHFSHHIYQSEVVIFTDHRPLVFLLQHASSSPKLNRWLLMLQEKCPRIQYLQGKANRVADCLSRSPPRLSWEESMEQCKQLISIPQDWEAKTEEAPYLLTLDRDGSTPPNPVPSAQLSEIQKATSRDTTLAEVINLVRRGWQNARELTEELRPYGLVRQQLHLHNDTLQMNGRVVVPRELQAQALSLLHRGHLGINRMKAKARNLIWWPRIDKAIEELACDTCSQLASNPPRTALQPWPRAEFPMERLHADYAGPFLSASWLIIVDAHSKYVFAERLTDSQLDAASTIRLFQHIFAEHGHPVSLVTDNGPQFISEAMRAYLEANGVKHMLSPTFHPASNGLAERVVRTFKEGMKKITAEGVPHREALLTWLLEHRSTPTSTGDSPALRFLGRELRTPLHVFAEVGHIKETHARERQRRQFPASHRQFEPGTPVWMKKGSRDYVPGVISEVLGNTVYQVKVDDATVNAHIDQLTLRRVPQRAVGIHCLSGDLSDSPPYDRPASSKQSSAATHEPATANEKSTCNQSNQLMVIDRALCKLNDQQPDDATRLIAREIRFGGILKAKQLAEELNRRAREKQQRQPAKQKSARPSIELRPKRITHALPSTLYITRTTPPIFFAPPQGTMPGHKLKLAPRNFFRGNRAGYRRSYVMRAPTTDEGVGLSGRRGMKRL